MGCWKILKPSRELGSKTRGRLAGNCFAESLGKEAEVGNGNTQELKESFSLAWFRKQNNWRASAVSACTVSAVQC